MTTIKEQLEEYCDCLEVKETDVNELINLISVYTCWTDEQSIKMGRCDNFLTGERTEVIDIPDCACECDVYEFEPRYQPFDPDSFTFTLIEQDGINETATEITEFAYSMVDGVFRIKLPLPECGCKSPCGCEENYKLLVTYVAGYDQIPDCLLPVFCEALQWIKVKNTCDCNECEPCKLDPEVLGEIDYTTLTGRLQDYFLNVLTVQYAKQIRFMGVCRPVNDLWGVVV